MTTHRDKYPQLADSLTFAKVRDCERGLHSAKTLYIPKTSLTSRDVKEFLRDGDVAFIVSSIDGLDVAHAGIIFKDAKGVPHLLHASTVAGEVIEDSVSLSDYLAKQKKMVGIRIVRLK